MFCLAYQNGHQDVGPLGNIACKNVRMEFASPSDLAKRFFKKSLYLVEVMEYVRACLCFCVPTYVHSTKDSFGLEPCHVDCVSCSGINFWLAGSRFCGSLLCDREGEGLRGD